MRTRRIKSILFPERRYEAPRAHGADGEADPFQARMRATLPGWRDWFIR